MYICVYIQQQKRDIFPISQHTCWKSHHAIFWVPGERIQPRSWGSSVLEKTKGPNLFVAEIWSRFVGGQNKDENKINYIEWIVYKDL